MLRALLVALLPSVAFAQEAAPAASPDAQFAGMLPLLVIFVIFYFLLIRPQQKRMKEHQGMLGELKKGDEVVTGGGIVGKVTSVGADDKVTVEISKGVEVAVVKSTIQAVLGKQAAKPAAAPKKKPSHVKNDNAVVSREDVANDN